MTNEIFIIKRNGNREALNLEKMHFVVEQSCEGLNGVSASQIEMTSNLQFKNGMTTDEIQNILIKSASDLISLETPNYQYAAARLLLWSLRKQVFGRFEYFSLTELLERNISVGVYDAEILKKYTPTELKKLNTFIKHERDLDFTYAGLQQLVDKYLVQDRGTKQIFETPQFMFLLVAATLFAEYPAETRLKYVKDYYDALSTFKINLPTPVLAGVRTPIRQFASCVLIDVGDSLDSIFSSNTAVGKYIARRAGLGINFGRIRGINSKIRDGEVLHTGVIPFLKVFESTVRSCSQNGIRGGNGTINFPIWHQEIEDIIVLKNNKGTEDSRVRKLDYCISLSKLFYERFISDGEISLFSPHEVPGLYEAFGTSAFDELYCKYEKDKSKVKKKIKARQLFIDILKERIETGRIYLMNIDHFNDHSSFLDKIYMTNLCTEISLPTAPIKSMDDEEGEIALCILSSLNVGLIKSNELEYVCELAVRALDALIDYQDYPVKAAEITKLRRSLGIGFTGLAHYLAKCKRGYEEKEAAILVHRLAEATQYYLLKASNKLAQEIGPCAYFNRTKYSRGILPVDTYKKDIDALIGDGYLELNWEELRDNIKKYGLRNSTLTAQAPVESSSLVTNSTNGIEPPRALLSVKKSKKGVIKQIVPQFEKLKNQYTLLWEMKSNSGYINIVGAMQKFFDQAISANWSYNPMNYENHELPLQVVISDWFHSYKAGLKTNYYLNMYDMKTDDSIEDQHLKNVKSNAEQNTEHQQEYLTAEEEHCESCTI
jgi:ribonucleoside-diphosphate reductase alpha chain